MTDLTADIRTRVAALGYEVVDVRRRGTSRPVLQVRLDRSDAAPGRGITVDECARVSRALEAWLDDTGVLGERYALEVSSPGLARPVRWREHWERFAGRDVHVRLPGRGRVTATIVRVEPGADQVVLRPAGEAGELAVPLDEVRDATLVVDWDAVNRALARERRRDHDRKE